MLPRVEKLPKPDPDFRHLLTAIERGKPRRVSMLEIKLDDEIQAALLGEPLIGWNPGVSDEQRVASVRQHLGLMHRLGYDAVRIRTPIPFVSSKAVTDDTADLSRGQRAWQDEHTGPIQTMADFDAYPWPRQADVDYALAEEFARQLPEGMGAIGYVSGVFEWTSWMMGLEPFMLALYEQPELVQALSDRVGQIIYDAMVPYMEMDHVIAVWVGDDMGFKTSTLISPAHLEDYVLPWHRKYAELAHRAGKPYLLHSCGNIGQIMEDLVNDVQIDAKHSFEEVIEPVEDFHMKWRHKVAAIGGVDIDLLARGTEAEVKNRARQILNTCAPEGAYVAGSGNSVTNYIPVDNYLAMVESLHEYNGRM